MQNASHDRPPHSTEAEKGVLGAMLRSNDAIPEVMLILRAEDFYADAHQKTFKAISRLHEKGTPVDPVTLGVSLEAHKWIEDVGYDFLAELWAAVGSGAHAANYAAIVREKALMRNLIHCGTEILRDAYNQNAPAEEVVAESEAKILRIAENGRIGTTHTLSASALDAMDEIDAAHQSGKSRGVSSGFAHLEEFTGGFQPGELVVVAARTSVGKTALALNVANNMAADGAGVFFASLEMSRVEIASRLLCSEGSVDTHFVRRPSQLTTEDRDKLVEAYQVFKGFNFHIADAPYQTVLQIASNARRLKRRNGIGAVFVDYLQLVEPDDRREPRYEQLGTITRRLKALGAELGLPVIALSQLVRLDDGQEPQLHHLRESGNIEQDANTVMLMYRPSSTGPTVLKIAKQRNGRTGAVEFLFRKEFVRFEMAIPGGS